VGAKLHSREGNNPDHQLRPRILGLVSKDVRSLRQPGGWLRSATLERVRNSSLVE